MTKIRDKKSMPCFEYKEEHDEILRFLKKQRVISDDFISPTVIGRGLKIPRITAWVSSRLFHLLKGDLVERNKSRHWRFKL